MCGSILCLEAREVEMEAREVVEMEALLHMDFESVEPKSKSVARELYAYEA